MDSPPEPAAEISAESLSSGGHRLWSVQADGTRRLEISAFEYQALDHDNDEQRFLVLHPCDGGNDDPKNHVRCELEVISLLDTPSFIAVKNARGYRKLQEPIEVNGKALLTTKALESFLRHFRANIEVPTRLWIRHVCLDQPDDEERTRYWTRDFADTMHATAVEVIDMAEYNSALVANGTAGSVTNLNYPGWRKAWYEVPKDAVMPSVFPIRLGKRPSNDVPTDEYDYVPLDTVADEIRVLLLVPSPDPWAPVIVHVGHCPIRCEVTFSALSYRWGDDNTQAEIVMNGQKKSIRKTLQDILRILRRSDQAIALWIDAVSINQDDVAERNRQIPRMGEIYEAAVSVISYAGPASVDCDLALELVNEFKEPMMRLNQQHEWHFGPWGARDGQEGGGLWYGANRISPPRLARMCAALYNFLIRPYFRRVWVLQELAWASIPTVGIGDNFETSFEKLDKAVYHLDDMLRSDLSLPGQMMDADPSLHAVDRSKLAFVRKLFYFRHLVCGGANTTMIAPVARIASTAPGFLETLVLARDFECTDPKDKIYALFNIARDKAGLDFTIDYAQSTAQVYMNFARAWILQHRSLDIIGSAECVPSSTLFYREAASWSPDWSVASTASSLTRRERIPTTFMAAVSDLDGTLYCAHGGLDNDRLESPLFWFEQNILCCIGLILDHIDFVLEDPPAMPGGMQFPSCEPESYYRFHCWTVGIEQYYHATRLATYEDPVRAATAMFHGDVPAAWPPRAENPENCSDSYPDERYVCDPSVSRHVTRYAGDYNRTQAWDVVNMVLRGRIPFFSEGGYMGLAPSYIKNDECLQGQWLLAIIATCSVPVLLKARPDGSYQMCGTCFVQGWMEGDILRDMVGAETLQDFWSAVAEGGMLRIT